MIKDGKKAAVIVGGVTLAGIAGYLLTRKAEAAPPLP